MPDKVFGTLSKFGIAAAGVLVIYSAWMVFQIIFDILPWTWAVAVLIPVLAVMCCVAIYAIWFVKGMTDESGKSVEEVLLSGEEPK